MCGLVENVNEALKFDIFNSVCFRRLFPIQSACFTFKSQEETDCLRLSERETALTDIIGLLNA